jgi:hypothetical protein
MDDSIDANILGLADWFSFESASIHGY